MASELSFLLLSSYMLAGGQTLCSFSDIRKLDGKHNDEFSHFMHVTVSFGNVGGLNPCF